MIHVIKEELIQCCICGKNTPFKMQSDKINNNEEPYVCNICDREGSSQEGDKASAIEVALHGGNGTSTLEDAWISSRKENRGNRISTLGDDLTSSRSDAEGSGTSVLGDVWTPSRKEAGGNRTTSLGEDLTSSRSVVGGDGTSSLGEDLTSSKSAVGGDGTSPLGEDLTSSRSAVGGDGTSSFGGDQKSPRNNAGWIGASSPKEEADSKGHSTLGGDLAPLLEKDDDDSPLQGEGSLLRGDDLIVKAENASRHDDNTNYSAALTTSSKVLQLHIKAISPKNYFTCSICDKIFCRAYSLKRHERVHNNDRPFCCDICGKAFSSSFSLNRHGRVHASVKRPRTCDAKCSICSQSLPGNSSLARHLREVHPGEKGFICNICGEGLSTMFSLKRHESRHTMKAMTVSSKSSSFVRHKKMGKTPTRNAEELECRFCGKFLPSASSLIRHVGQAHPGRKPFSCKICGKGFLNWFNLKRHGSHHTMTKTTISKESSSSVERLHTNYVECRICGQSLPDASSLIRHVRQAHPGKKRYSCKICGKGFFNMFNLKRHGSIHAIKETSVFKESPASVKLPHTCDVECQICGQFLPTTSSLARHVGKVHPSEKAVNCNICGEGFSTMFNLKRHESVHTIKETPVFKESPASVELPHTCDVECQICGQSQPSATSPTLHVRRDHPGGNAYSCGKAFQRLYNLRRHEKIHTDKINDSKVSETPTCSVEQIECSICGLFLPSASTQARHIRKAHPNEKMYSCKICGKAFTRLDNLKRHQNIHADKKRASESLNCDICGKFFIRKDCLKKHRSIHIIKKVDTSGKLATVTKSLQVKQDCLSGSEENHECETNDAFSLTLHSRHNVHNMESNAGNENRETLPSHQKSNFECVNICIKLEHCDSDDLCGESSQPSSSEMCPRASSRIDRHRRVQADETSFKCGRCEQVFARELDLRSHQRSHQSIHTKKKTFMCEICGKFLTDKFTHFEHQRIHTKEQPYTCDICFRPMRYFRSLKKHMRLHEKDDSSLRELYEMMDRNLSKPKCFVCGICKKSFKRLSSFKRHYFELHSKNTPKFVCEFCNKSYASKYRLKYHKSRVHSREKPVLCEVCGKGFAAFSLLKIHQRLHNGEKPYSCKLCGTSFNQPNSLTRHERIHSNEKPYVCERCGRAFSQDNSLKRHQKVHEKRSDSKWDAEVDGEGDDGSETDVADGEGDDGSETDVADGEGDDESETDVADGNGDDGSETDGASESDVEADTDTE